MLHIYRFSPLSIHFYLSSPIYPVGLCNALTHKVDALAHTNHKLIKEKYENQLQQEIYACIQQIKLTLGPIDCGGIIRYILPTYWRID